MVEITEEEIKKELEKINAKKICSVCNKKLPKTSIRARKYHPECGKIMARLQGRKSKQIITPEQKQKNRLSAKVRHQMESHSCSYQQHTKCVRTSIEIDGIKINIGGRECPFKKNKEKCPKFKPRHPEIYKQICKIKENKNG